MGAVAGDEVVLAQHTVELRMSVEGTVLVAMAADEVRADLPVQLPDSSELLRRRRRTRRAPRRKIVLTPMPHPCGKVRLGALEDAESKVILGVLPFRHLHAHRE